MHVLRLQSCDTLWVLMHGISVERVVCMLFILVCYSSRWFVFVVVTSAQAIRKATVSCTSDFILDTIQYSLFIYSDNYQIRSQVDAFFCCIFSLRLQSNVCRRGAQ